MDRVRISRRDTTDTAITVEPTVSSLNVQSFSLSPGTEVGTSLVDEGVGTEVGTSIVDEGVGTEVGSS